MRRVLLVIAAPAVLAAQAADTTQRGRGDSARALEAVTIRAVRARDDAPISSATLSAADIERRSFGQDVPQLLQGTPSLTSYAETGNYWGYSYIRMRGIDQSRINFTIDGIPLNDPEDQVLYFADFPDLMNSVTSVQIQRGVGTSAPGTASYGGSINFETIPVAAAGRAGNGQLQGGSFGSARGSAEYATGLSSQGFAAYGRASATQSGGYRRHSGTEGRSAFLSAAYVRERDLLKLTALVGLFADTLAYIGATESELAVDRRFNPLRPDETDRFGEQLAALSYTRYVGGASSVAVTAYRISASGNYNVCIDRCDAVDGLLGNFNLDFAWYGATGTWSAEHAGGRARSSVGVNANTYARDHYALLPTDGTFLYENTGRKGDVSGFAKLAYDVGRITLFGDLQARQASFRYLPDAFANLDAASVSWTFLNPKAGLSIRATPSLVWYASYGVNGREPARSDMLGGLDNLTRDDTSVVGFLDRVKPEHAHDVETGLHYRTALWSADANVFSMTFRDEILPIGELTWLGTPVRDNVRSSWRRGVEMDASFRATPALMLGATATLMDARIADYTDAQSGTAYHDVRPLMTPALTAAQRVSLDITPSFAVGLDGRYTSRQLLTNTGNATLRLPSYYTTDVSARWRRGMYAVSVFLNNVGDAQAYAGGHVSGTEARYYVVPPRNAFVLVAIGR
jgi:iron complex outermembrane recepter protein